MHATQHPTIFIFAQFQYFFSIWITANAQEGDRSYEILPFVKDRDAKKKWGTQCLCSLSQTLE